MIQKIETQGRYGNGTGREFTEYYFLDYWRFSNNNKNNENWIRYTNLSGNQVIL